jgi:hypothetical protein
MILIARIAFIADLLFSHRLIDIPLRSFAAHETLGGHTLARHVGQRTSGLSARLLANARVQRVSTFWTERAARICVAYAVSRDLAGILAWLGSPAPARYPIHARIPPIGWVGFGVVRGLRRPRLTRNVRVVLARLPGPDFYVLTAFPE